MLFGPGVLIAGASFITIVVLEKTAEDFGITWLSTTLKLVVPIVAILFAIFFLETNALLRWLR
ncbi:hypothetical protein F4694_004094 [Bacillus niacini]|uniref:Uncharacterized protein n=1 Tax=Neobacillus niacini TaxID=86668 RepID=A0A852TGN4_9BACI|nr:hypothetical protein [Neobacillus niacini]NYE07309.1 hypothetical protein [Neobacillus niacini]